MPPPPTTHAHAFSIATCRLATPPCSVSVWAEERKNRGVRYAGEEVSEEKDRKLANSSHLSSRAGSLHAMVRLFHLPSKRW